MLDQSESEVLKSLYPVLDHFKEKKLLTYRRISTTGIPRQMNRGTISFSKNPAAGMADLLIALKCRRGEGWPQTLHIEVKRFHVNPYKLLSPSQLEWKSELEELGHLYYAVCSSYQLYSVLKLHGIKSDYYDQILGE